MFYGQAVRFLGRCKTGAFGPKTCFKALFVGQNCQICLRSGLRGLSPLAPPLQAVDRKISLLLPLQILGSLIQWTFPEELFVNSEPDHCDIGPRLRDWRFCEVWSSGVLSSQWILNSTIYPLSLQMPFVKSWRSLFPLIVLFPLVSPQVLEIKTKKFKA